MHETSAGVDPKHTYSRGADILASCAVSFGLKVSDEAHEEWRLLIRTAYELDNILDSNLPADDRKNKFDNLVTSIVEPETNPQIGSCPDSCSFCKLGEFSIGWDERRRTSIVDVANTIKEVSTERRQTAKPTALGKLAIIEGSATARWFGLPTNEDGSKQFYDWLENLTVSGVALDSAVDLEEDYMLGIHAVKPNITRRMIVASFGIPFLAKTLRHTKPSLVRDLVSGARAVIDDRDKDLAHACIESSQSI